MRRTARSVLSLLLAAGLTAASLPGSGSTALAAPGERPDLPASASPVAVRALATAERVLAGEGRPGDASPSLALRDLFLSLPELGGADRRAAEAVLARPTDPDAADPRPTDRGDDAPGGPYTTTPVRTCATDVCLHHVTTGRDAPPSPAWARLTLDTVQDVWDHHVGELGYRPPLPDGTRGGDQRLDVYLKDIGGLGFYGYCATERRPDPERFLASGYCVLDDDFAAAQFGGEPIESLRVTAAHEFFHAVQYAYDFAEDKWLLEATATWIEERYADDVDDNRQYLTAGQLRRPRTPLDHYREGSAAPYGNWVFFEHLSQRFGRGVVKAVWNRAADFAGAPDQHSTQAVRSVVASRRVAFPTLFSQYAAAGTAPATFYSEGASWPRGPIAQTFTLRPGRRGTGPVRTRLDHLTSTSWDLRRGDLPGRWAVLLRVDGPARATSPAAHALVHLDGGKVQRRVVRLGRSGDARVRLPFHTGVAKVTLTLANASTRYRCWQRTTWSCQGRPTDDDEPFRFSAYAVR